MPWAKERNGREDFIEATGRILRVGNTSREIAFEAYKVIERTKSGSRARVLKKPILVARARGTCVVHRSFK